MTRNIRHFAKNKTFPQIALRFTAAARHLNAVPALCPQISHGFTQFVADIPGQTMEILQTYGLCPQHSLQNTQTHLISSLQTNFFYKRQKTTNISIKHQHLCIFKVSTALKSTCLGICFGSVSCTYTSFIIRLI